MRKILCLLAALLLCLGMGRPALAQEGTFVDSISGKEGPPVRDARFMGEPVRSCVAVTSVRAAREGSTDITQEERDQLLQVYQDLEDGSMAPPLGAGFVIRELIAVSWQNAACRESHDHAASLLAPGAAVTADFDLGLMPETEVRVYVRSGDGWEEVPTVRGENGAVTCTLSTFGILAFCVAEAAPGAPVRTEGASGLWAGLLAAAAAAAVGLVVLRKRKG